MLERLNTEEQLAKYAGWFIPLKMESSGEAWGEWRKKYPHEGNSIPIVFVIRADGEKLYGKSGSLPGEQLYQLLNTSLNNSGVLLDDRQLATIHEAVQKTKKLIEANEPLAAVKQLMRVSKIGTPGQIGCYANVAIAADELANQLTEKATSMLEEATNKIGDVETRFDGLADAMKCADAYGRLPSINKEMKALRASWNRDDQLKATVKQVKQFQKLEKQIKKGKVSRKLDSIRDFVNKHADEEAMVQRAILLVADIVKPELAQNNGEVVNWVTMSGEIIAGRLVVNHDTDGSIIIITDDDSRTVKAHDLDPVSQAMAKLRDREE